MKNFLHRSVPAWTLVLMMIFALMSGVFAIQYASEANALKDAIRAQEARVPGFVNETSILSERAMCRRNLIISLKDRLIGSDSCEKSF